MKFNTAFFLVLFVLKVASIGDAATWSWWLVTAPLWVSYTLSVMPSLLAGVREGLEKVASKYK